MSTLKVNTIEESTTNGGTYSVNTACCNWNGTGTVSIRHDRNVSTITDMGLGRYRVNFSTAMSNAAHSTVSAGGDNITDYASQNNSYDHETFQGASTTSNIPIFAIDHDGGEQTDASYLYMITTE